MHLLYSRQPLEPLSDQINPSDCLQVWEKAEREMNAKGICFHVVGPSGNSKEEISVSCGLTDIGSVKPSAAEVGPRRGHSFVLERGCRILRKCRMLFSSSSNSFEGSCHGQCV